MNIADDDFTKLYKLIVEIRNDMATKQDVANIEQEIDMIKSILDQHTSMLDRDGIERLALGAQVSRHEDWIERTASKTGVRYSPAN